MFSANKKVESKIFAVVAYAHKNHQAYISIEHILLALLKIPEVAVLCHLQNIELRLFSEELIEYLESQTPKAELQPDGTYPLPQLQLPVQRLLSRVSELSESMRSSDLCVFYLLIAIIDDSDSTASILMKKYRLGRIQILRHHFSNIKPHAPLTKKRSVKESDYLDQYIADGFSVNPTEEREATATTDEATENSNVINLNHLAADQTLPPMIGRTHELERLTTILCRRYKNNPILVGDAGVGKTAIVHGLAHAIVKQEVPSSLCGSTIYALQIGQLIAGTKYRGDFEKKMVELISFITNNKEAILFIDEIHTIIGVGSTNGNSLDVANLLKPILTGGQFRCIGATTFDEYRTIFEKDSALSRRFGKIDVPEPSFAETEKILKEVAQELERHHRVRYSGATIKKTVALASRYIHDRKLPDKAIDILDEVGAKQHAYHGAQKPSTAPAARGRYQRIVPTMIEEHVAGVLSTSPHTLSQSMVKRINAIESSMKKSVLGQNDAIDTVLSAVKRFYAGLRNPTKPIGQFLFVGPSGVGKTLMCQILSQQLQLSLLRFDMSEFSEDHSVSRLVGSPPGYVGFSHGGQLTEKLYRNPHSIVLIDEIEKASPVVHQLFLQIMDHGTLTDHHGREISFQDAMIIFTSNLGFDHSFAATIGFSEVSAGVNVSDAKRELGKVLPLEFRARLDKTVVFNYLTRPLIRKIVEIKKQEFINRRGDRTISIRVDDSVLEYLTALVLAEEAGSRPCERLVEQYLSDPLSEAILHATQRRERNKKQPRQLIVLSREGSQIVYRLADQREKATLIET